MSVPPSAARAPAAAAVDAAEAEAFDLERELEQVVGLAEVKVAIRGIATALKAWTPPHPENVPTMGGWFFQHVLPDFPLGFFRCDVSLSTQSEIPRRQMHHPHIFTAQDNSSAFS